MKLEKFDYQIGNKRKKSSFIVLGLVCLGAFITVILYRTFANYEVTNSYNIIGGKVAKFAIDGLTMYLVNEDGTEVATSIVPTEAQYVYDAARSQCINGTEIVYDSVNKTISIDESAGDTCNVYFKYIPLAKQTLYALGYSDSDIKTGIPYGPNGLGAQGVSDISGFYAAEDDYGTSYYYYNDASDFSPVFDHNNSWWMLLRINGDGSIRMYKYTDGLNTNFSSDNGDNAYLGYMFGNLGVENIENIYSSNIKNYLQGDTFIINNDLISDTIFCNDRSLYLEEYGEPESDDSKSGIGTNTTYYGAYYRLKYDKPTLKCIQKNDAFTVDDEVYGNGKLEKAIGLITADEAYMTNMSWYYLWHSYTMLSMTPMVFKDGIGYNYLVNDNSFFDNSNLISVTSTAVGIYPVINLKYGLEFSGTGIMDDPYIIVE